MKTSDHQTQSKAVAKYFGYFVFFFIACALVYHVCQLSQYVPFHDWDEAIYAQVSKEWVRHPGFTLTYNGSSWFEKPPLPSLLYSLAWLIPQLRPEFVARLISAFISFITLIFVYKIIYWLTDKVSLSLLAVFVTLQSALFLDRSVLVNVDIFLALGWVGYLWAIKTKSSILKLAFTLIGTLSKSLLGFFPLIAEICIDCLSRSINREKIKVYLLTVFAGLSWQIFMIVIYGQSFIQSHFIDHMVSRVTRPIELHFGDKFFYGVRLWQESHIWLLLALGGTVVILLLAFYQLIKRKEIYIPKHYQLPLMMLFIFVGYFSLLTISKSKIHWYITPLIPLVCMGAIYVWHIGISYIKKSEA